MFKKVQDGPEHVDFNSSIVLDCHEINSFRSDELFPFYKYFFQFSAML